MADERRKQLDAFHRHEALDRSFLALEFFSEYVREHPAVHADPKLRRQAEAIVGRMYKLYQSLGDKSFDGQDRT